MTKDALLRELDHIDQELSGEGTVVNGVSDTGWALIVAFVADWLLAHDTDPPTAPDRLAGMWLREMANG